MINEKSIKFFFIIVCILQLFYLFHYRSGFKYEVVINPLLKNSGIKFAVPSETIEVKRLIRKHNLVYFNLSENIKKDVYLYQRTVEFNYPARIENNSKFIYLLKKEKKKSSCTVVENADYLKLIKC